MIFYPKKYFGNILEITVDFLQNNKIEGILLDIDNTIIDKDNKIIEGLEKWVENIKKNNIKICILSNTNRKAKAQKLSKLIDVPYIFFAKKPLKGGFRKAQNLLGIEDPKNIAVIGDQVLTDVFGANRCKMYSILVKPLQPSDILVTKINRNIEKIILKKYFKENNIKQK